MLGRLRTNNVAAVTEAMESNEIPTVVVHDEEDDDMLDVRSYTKSERTDAPVEE